MRRVNVSDSTEYVLCVTTYVRPTRERKESMFPTLGGTVSGCTYIDTVR